MTPIASPNPLKSLGLASLVLLAGLAGCLGGAASDDEAAAPPAGEPIPARFVATDYALQGPRKVEAGLLEVTLENRGTEMHHVIIYRLPADRSLDELRDALVEGHGVPPEWTELFGGPNVALPGGPPTKAYVALEPGEYAVLCLIPSPDHATHLEKGMIAPLTVVPSGRAPAAPPAPDVTATLHDFRFDLSAPLTAGTHTLRVVNEGTNDHEVVVFELFGNATPMEFLQAMEAADPTSPPPGRPVGGVTPFSTGREATIELTLTPGRYFLVCFDVSGTPHGEPHFAMGMLQEFTVA